METGKQLNEGPYSTITRRAQPFKNSTAVHGIHNTLWSPIKMAKQGILEDHEGWGHRVDAATEKFSFPPPNICGSGLNCEVLGALWPCLFDKK